MGEESFLCYEAQGWGLCSLTGDGYGISYYPQGQNGDQSSVVSFSPPQSRWDEFWKLVESLNVWEWDGVNFGENVMCGTPWKLTLRHDHQK